MKNKYFIDTECNSNLREGIEYYAVGLIDGDYTDNGKPSGSGKDYAVVYINPWGEVEREWRAKDEIKIVDIDESDYENLKRSIKEREKAQNSK